MSKGTKILIGFFAVCFIVTVASIIVQIATKDKVQAREEAKKESVTYNYQLIKDNVFDAENNQFTSSMIKESDTPANLKELPYAVVRKYQNEGEDFTWEYSGSCSNLGDIRYVKWTEEDLNNIPVVVFAISEYQSRTYQYVSGGVGTTSIRSETVKIYFYNTKTNTVFKTDVMEGKPLPESTNNSHDYVKSLYDVDNTIKKDMGRFVLPSWVVTILAIGGLVGFFILMGVISGFTSAKKKK